MNSYCTTRKGEGEWDGEMEDGLGTSFSGRRFLQEPYPVRNGREGPQPDSRTTVA